MKIEPGEDVSTGPEASKHKFDADVANSERKCEQCKESGQAVVASGFCKDCNDYLCGKCFQQHKTFRGTRNHALLEGAQMSQKKHQKSDPEMCRRHPDKPLELYCQSDDTFGCYLCMAIDHRLCPKVESIVEMSKNVESTILEISQEHKDLVARYRRCIQEKHSSNIACYEQSLKDFQTFRAKKEDMLNKVGETVAAGAAMFLRINKDTLDNLSDQLTAHENKLETAVSNIAEMKSSKQLNSWLTSVKKNREEVVEAMQKLIQLFSNIQVQTYAFQEGRTMKGIIEEEAVKVVSKPINVPNGDTTVKTIEDKEKMIKEKTSIGGIKAQSEQINGKRGGLTTKTSKKKKKKIKGIIREETKICEIKAPVEQFNCKSGEITVKTSEDKKNCRISGIVEISPSELVVTDSFNKCVKRVDVDKAVILKRLEVSSDPSDVTMMPGSRVAVALRDQKQLLLLSVVSGLVPCGNIAVNGKCLGVACIGEKLVVSFFNPGTVEIIDFAGRCLRAFTSDPLGKPLFSMPRYLSFSPDHKSVYISDWHNKTVTSLSTKGTVEWQYRQSECVQPFCMATAFDDSMYICCRVTNTIHVVAATGAKKKVFAFAGFKSPRAICISRYHTMMYSSSDSTGASQCNVITRFSLPK